MADPTADDSTSPNPKDFFHQNAHDSLFTTPLQALISVNCKLNETVAADSLQRQVNFMCYELATQCGPSEDEETFQILNEYFFNHKKFMVSTEPILLSEVLAERKGCGMAIALLFCHLASGLGLKIQIIHLPVHTILCWTREGQAHYIDINLSGKILSEEEVLAMVNQHKEFLQSLSLQEALVQYLSYISMNCRQTRNSQNLLITLNMILRIQPENTRYLAERGLLRKELGLIKEALSDFKRYFSFTNRADASVELVRAFEELQQ